MTTPILNGNIRVLFKFEFQVRCDLIIFISKVLYKKDPFVHKINSYENKVWISSWGNTSIKYEIVLEELNAFNY